MSNVLGREDSLVSHQFAAHAVIHNLGRNPARSARPSRYSSEQERRSFAARRSHSA